jgi:amino acid transporter
VLLDYLLIPTLGYVLSAAVLAPLLPGVPQWLWIAVFVLFNTAVNLFGIASTALLSRIFLIGELVVLALFTGFGTAAVAAGRNGAHSTLDPFPGPDLTPGLVCGALSVAVLGFLGLDGIATLSEEVRGGDRRLVGQATLCALAIVAALFVLQTCIAALLVPGRTQFSGDDAVNSAFYGIAAIAGGHWLETTTAVASALSLALACSLVAQAPSARLLFSMARERTLPAFLGTVHPARRVPQRAVLLIAGPPGDRRAPPPAGWACCRPR